jgi:hypothetical protein
MSGRAPQDFRIVTLQQVSHWTEDDVQRESRINDRPDVTSSYVLDDKFDEIFDFFKFGDQA